MPTLHEVATSLGVHYMTAYRYVRLGMLPAHKSDGQWRITDEDLAGFMERRTDAPARTSHAPYAERYRSRAISADLKGAWSVCENALASGHSLEQVYLDIIAPTMADIGRSWETGELSVADEHRASAVVMRTIGRLSHRLSRPGRTRGAVVIGAVSGDMHALPVTIAADVMRGRGFDVIDLGGNTPIESFVESARDTDGLRAVVVTVSTTSCLDRVQDTLDELRAALPDVAVFIGGGALDASTATDIGIEHFTGVEQLLDRLTGTD